MDSPSRIPLILQPISYFFLFLLIILVVFLPPHISFAAAREHPSGYGSDISYHGGPILTGEVKLSILWYGPYDTKSKTAILNFVESLNNVKNVSFIPSVAQWWGKVESYQLLGKQPAPATATAKERHNHHNNYKFAPEIKVTVVKQIEDPLYSQGLQLSSVNYLNLVKNAASGTPSGTVAVILANRLVAVEDVCKGPHYIHSVDGKQQQLYIVVANPGNKCPRETWLSPYESENLFIKLTPPNGNNETDGKIIHLAAALAGTVTNPYSNGFYGESKDKKQARIREIGNACEGVFGSGAFPGYTGRLRLDPKTNANFNAHGINQSKFMLPAIWDFQKRDCWTLL